VGVIKEKKKEANLIWRLSEAGLIERKESKDR
jgi:hypothetical protein